MDEMQHLKQELQRLIYRDGDLNTMRRDKVRELESIDREATATQGAIDATRIRIGNLERDQATRKPQLVPMDMTPVMDVQPIADGKPAQLAKK